MARPIIQALNRIVWATALAYVRQGQTGRRCLSTLRLSVIAVGLLLSFYTANAADQGLGPVVLDNEHLRIEIDPGNGAITRISDKQGQIQLAPADGLADNFRLVLRSADKKDRLIMGRSQKLSGVSKVGGMLDLAWKQPLADTEGGKHNLQVRMKIRATGESLEFRFFLRNESAHKVAEAWYPLIGGLTGLGRGQAKGATFVMLPTASPSIKKATMPFGEMALQYPGHMTMSFSSVFNTKAGRAMYFAAHDSVARLKYYRFFEQSSPAGNDVFACIQHMPFTPAGERFEGSPAVLRFHNGTWHDAGPIYRDWFTKTFGLMDPSRSWIRRHSFVQDTMFILPEGTLNYTFKDIPRWAKAARDHGITAVLVSGWHRGGHDNGYPHYEPDPRLGTYEDLQRGLDTCHKMGVRVYFFVNYRPAMIESDWFKRELNRYVEMREDGSLAVAPHGWGMGTLWARMGNPKRMTWIDPSFPEYRDFLVRQFLKLVEAGADGLHVDKMYCNNMNFNPRCELGPDTSALEGAIRLTRMVFEQSRKINAEFAMSFECNWDRMLEFGNTIWWVGNMSLVRSVFPEMVETRALTSPYDYLGVNDAVRSSQVGLLGPLNYTRAVGWEPWKGQADYIREVKRIQDRLSETIFLGEVLGHEQIQLEHEPQYGVEYNVFRSLKTGKRACILTNNNRDDRVQGIRGFAGVSGGSLRIHTPFAPPRDAGFPVKVTVPAERIVFVEELPPTASRDGGSPPPVGVDLPAVRATDGVLNGGFESGDLTGRTADPNWRVDPVPEFDDQKSIKLENDHYHVEVSRANGTITRILDTATDLDLIREPRLAGNFKFTLPLPGKEPWETIEANYILGKDQPLSSFNVDGRTLTLVWRDPLTSRSGQKYDVAAAMGVELQDEAMRFTLRIENNTPYQLGEVFFPILGGITGLGNTYRELKMTQLVRPTGAVAVATSNIFSIFANRSGLGDQGPEQFYSYPNELPEPWMEFYSPGRRRSLYLGSHDSVSRSKVLHLEMLPGNAETPRWDGNWPRPEELNGLPVGVLVSFVDFANHSPGKTYQAPMAVLRVHDGDWHEGRRIYRKWEDSR